MANQKKGVNPKAPSNHAAWTKKDIKTLKEMSARNCSASQIALELGRTRASVWARKHMLGISERLSSSKGEKNLAPATVGTRTPRNSREARKERVARRAQVAQTSTLEKNLQAEFSTLSQLAKKHGAKIVITFE
jgi:hypothetical protein